MPPDDKRKISVYKEFITLFDQAFADGGFERHKVPDNNSFLSTIKIPSRTN